MCGREIADDVLLLQPDDGAATTTTVVAHESRRPRVPPRTLAIVGAVIALIAVVSIVSSGGGGSSGTTTSQTAATTIPSTATIPPSAPTTVAGPLLPGASGEVLVESTVTGLRLTDVTTGASKVVREATLADAGELIPRAGGVVAVHDTPTFVPLPAGDPLVAIPMPQGATAVTVYPSFAPDHLWFEEFGPGGTRKAVEVDLFGVPSSAPVGLPSAAVIVGAVDGGLVVGAAGSIFVVTPQGGQTFIGNGDPIAAAGHTIFAVDCAASLVCGFRVFDTDGGPSHLVPLPLGVDANVNGLAAISADGSKVAVSEVVGLFAQLIVVDTETLTVTPVPSGAVGLATTELVWSPDAQLLFWPVGSDGIRAWRVGDTTSQLLAPRPDKFETFTVVPNAGPLS